MPEEETQYQRYFSGTMTLSQWDELNWAEKYGWCFWDGKRDSIEARPWYSLTGDQQDHHSDQALVSIKDGKSYVYELVYSDL